MRVISSLLFLLLCVLACVSGQTTTSCSNGIRLNKLDNSTAQGARSSTASTRVVLPNGLQFIVSVAGQVGVWSYSFTSMVSTYGFPNATVGWVRQNVTGPAPSPRRGPSAAADAEGNLYIIGGTMWNGIPPINNYNDVWMHRYDPANGNQYGHTWLLLDSAAPMFGRYDAGFLVLPNVGGTKTMLYTAGAYDWQSLGAYSDVWKRELPGVWTNMNVTRAFDPRAGHALVYFKGAVYSTRWRRKSQSSLDGTCTNLENY